MGKNFFTLNRNVKSILKKYSAVLVILKTYSLAWKLRKFVVITYYFGALLEITGSILTIYATAKIAALLATFIVGGPTHDIWLWVAIDVFSAVIIGIGFWVMSYSGRLLYFSFVRWSTTSYLYQLCHIDYSDFYNEESRNRLNKVEQSVTWQIANLSSTSLELGYGVLRLIAISAIVSQIAWWVLPLIILFLIPSLLTESKIAKINWFVWDEKGDQRHVYWGLFWILKQPFSQLEIRSQNVQNFLTNKIAFMNKDFYDTQEQRFKSVNKRSIFSKMFEVGGTTISLVVLLKKFITGAINFEQYFFLSGALLRVGGAINAVFGTLARLQEPVVFAETFYEFIDIKPKLIDKSNPTKLKDNNSIKVEFKDVSFKYPGTNKNVFDNLNLTINAGDHIAIVGENGAGKTTLIKLLLRFYMPDKGTILINGHDNRTIEIETLYKQIATLFQSFNKYPFTITESIALEKEYKIDNRRLKSAVELSQVNEMVARLPYGYGTVLDSSFKKGIEPSGGQEQRIALARAFYRKANLLILDEPTSSIDAKAEYNIFNSIFSHYKNKTTIIISHRFSTVRRASRIIVLDKGKIVEQGSHIELMKVGGLYSELFEKQAAGYKD